VRSRATCHSGVLLLLLLLLDGGGGGGGCEPGEPSVVVVAAAAAGPPALLLPLLWWPGLCFLPPSDGDDLSRAWASLSRMYGKCTGSSQLYSTTSTRVEAKGQEDQGTAVVVVVGGEASLLLCLPLWVGTGRSVDEEDCDASAPVVVVENADADASGKRGKVGGSFFKPRACFARPKCSFEHVPTTTNFMKGASEHTTARSHDALASADDTLCALPVLFEFPTAPG